MFQIRIQKAKMLRIQWIQIPNQSLLDTNSIFLIIIQYTLYSDNRKQWNRTTLYQYLSVFNVVTKKIVLLKNQIKSGSGSVHNCCVSFIIESSYFRVFWLSLYLYNPNFVNLRYFRLQLS